MTLVTEDTNPQPCCNGHNSADANSGATQIWSSTTLQMIAALGNSAHGCFPQRPIRTDRTNLSLPINSSARPARQQNFYNTLRSIRRVRPSGPVPALGTVSIESIQSDPMRH